MGEIFLHPEVKLICGLIGREELFPAVRKKLERRFGPADFQSRAFDFRFTEYYKQEMGEGLKRVFLSFYRKVKPASLARIKLATNRIESRFSRNGKRMVNIDPGYLTLSKLVLATTKDHQHRIYLEKGIYAEVTLRYRGKGFRAWEWTYPDFQTSEYLEIFESLRSSLVKEKKE